MAISRASATYPLSTDTTLQGLSELRDRKLLCDVHLVTEGESFPVHRVVLAAASPYFHAMFTGGFKENELDLVTLEETSAQGLECILDAIYTAKISLSEENVDNILSVATLLQMNAIVKVCDTFLSTNNTANNCVKFLSIAKKYEFADAIVKCDEYILDNFEAFANTLEFTKITKEMLCRYISDDRLKVCDGEIAVFRIAVKWLKEHLGSVQNAATETSNETIEDVMNHVRFPQIPTDLLIDEVLQVPFIDENKQCRKLVQETLRFHGKLFTQPLQEGLQYKSRGEQKLLLISGGIRGTGYLVESDETNLHYLNTSESSPFSKEDDSDELSFSFAFRSLAVTTKGNYLFLFGTLNRLFYPIAKRYDVSNDLWLDLKAPPIQATVGSAIATLHDEIYHLGGMCVSKDTRIFDRKYLTSGAHKYTVATNDWAEECSMPKSLAYHSAVAYGNFVYVAGGACEVEEKSAALYVFDVLGKLWLKKAELNHARYSLCLEMVNNNIYAIGGISDDEGSHVGKIEVYSILNDQWTILQDVITQHCYLCTTVVLDDKLYILGGRQRDEDGRARKVATVSCLDLKSSSLTQVSNLPFPSTCHVCAILTVPRK